ncbi:MAG TPA: hypothetical protein VK533_15110 [Sphingomonas sp.]|uniref:hypothetical protein n=1 Tax=Sphingomonas sp. TaxID=28214 RepID=UPI002BFF78E3|nr:hypothetical protein [Sphingomonas sp.]HMI20863.1 hypothetical protein [Sphingomonas sp.]
MEKKAKDFRLFLLIDQEAPIDTDCVEAVWDAVNEASLDELAAVNLALDEAASGTSRFATCVRISQGPHHYFVGGSLGARERVEDMFGPDIFDEKRPGHAIAAFVRDCAADAIMRKAPKHDAWDDVG